MDGYAVNCIKGNQIYSLVFEMIKGNNGLENPKIMELNNVQTAIAQIL